MVLDQSTALAHALEEQVITCGYCPRKVVFAPTLIGGHALCFDAEPVPVSYDRDHSGWIPGRFAIDGVRMPVYAPWAKHPYAWRRRWRTVLHLHDCSGQATRKAA